MGIQWENLRGKEGCVPDVDVEPKTNSRKVEEGVDYWKIVKTIRDDFGNRVDLGDY